MFVVGQEASLSGLRNPQTKKEQLIELGEGRREKGIG